MNDERRIPMTGEVYLHFKGNKYQVICVAEHTETQEKFVIYHRYEPELRGKIYARPLSMFMSEVDRYKYPNVPQKYRFELVIDPNGIK